MKLLMLAIVLVLPSCQWNEANNPVSKEYPCGTRMYMCSSGACCGNTDDCGGDVLSCPAGSCCYAGIGARPDGKPTVTPQTRPGDNR